MYARTKGCYKERGSRTSYVRSSIPHCTTVSDGNAVPIFRVEEWTERNNQWWKEGSNEGSGGGREGVMAGRKREREEGRNEGGREEGWTKERRKERQQPGVVLRVWWPKSGTPVLSKRLVTEGFWLEACQNISELTFTITVTTLER